MYVCMYVCMYIYVYVGNSRLSEDMFEDGFQSIANIDISKVCVAQMQAK